MIGVRGRTERKKKVKGSNSKVDGAMNLGCDHRSPESRFRLQITPAPSPIPRSTEPGMWTED